MPIFRSLRRSLGSKYRRRFQTVLVMRGWAPLLILQFAIVVSCFHKNVGWGVLWRHKNGMLHTLSPTSRRPWPSRALEPSFLSLTASDINTVNRTETKEQRWSFAKVFHWDFISTFFGKILGKVVTDEDVLNITTKSISGILWFSIIIGALGTIGFDTKPILSIFGVAGITLGLSLQNLFADLYAGLFVLFTRPFKRGSRISVSGYTGRVVSIDMRYVTLHNDLDHSQVLLPITLVYRNAITILGDADETTH